MTTTFCKFYDWKAPEIVIEKLVETWGDAGLIWLDGDGSPLGRLITLAVDPIDQICCRGLPQEKYSISPFQALKKLSPGHWTGWLSYEAGAWIEPNNPWKHDSMATLWIASHDPVFKFDLEKKEFWVEGENKIRFMKFTNWLDQLSSRTFKKNFNVIKTSKGIPIKSWRHITSQADYIKNVNQIRNWIMQGDIFQANLTTCCTTSLPQGIVPLTLYQKLRQKCPAPFSGLVIGDNQAKGESIICASPERFMKVLPSGEIETRPIKGTRPRKSNPDQDAEMAAELVCSSKDRAENIMIVDLLRNDLGRVCVPGSINVSKLVDLESYKQVHHLTSVIKGCLLQKNTWVDLLEASWPGGSVTGAPKLRACQRLHELEPTARGPYCGSLINLDWSGTFNSNILIRSLFLKGDQIRANAGCGIVADSDSDLEAKEMQWKLIPLLEALQ